MKQTATGPNPAAAASSAADSGGGRFGGGEFRRGESGGSGYGGGGGNFGGGGARFGGGGGFGGGFQGGRGGDSSDGRGQRSGGRSGGDESQRGPGSGGSSSSGGDWLSRIDTNNNGMLEPSEIQASPSKSFLERSAKRNGLDLSKPVSLETIRGGRSSSRGGDSRGRPGSDGQEGRSEENKSAATPTTPLNRGFGSAASATPAVRGFGPPSGSPGQSMRLGRPLEGRATGGDGGGERGGSSSSGGTSGGEERFNRIAESIIKQNDTNKNGSLEREEWSRLRGDPTQTDADGNGVITKEEMAKQVASFSGGRSERPRLGSSDGDSRSGGHDNYSGSRSNDDSGASNGLKRFRTAIERLPEGLPSWFSQSDLDRDGQVMMHEFSSSWTESRASEFERLDLNGDGVITPQEAKSAGNR